MKKVLAISVLAASISLTLPNAATAASNEDAIKNEMIGFGSGALAGAVIAGPVGGVVGGILGLLTGNNVNQASEKKDLLASIQTQEIALQTLEQEYAKLQRDYEQNLMAYNAQTAPVKVSSDTSSLDVLPFEASLQFKTASSQLEQHYLANLDKVAEKLKHNPQLQVQLFGYADRRGDEQYNLTLSEQRAQEVRQYLLSRGVGASQIDTWGYGEAQPVNVAQNQESDFFDRRVVLRMATQDGTMTAKNEAPNNASKN